MIHRTPFGKFSKWALISLNAFSPLRSNLESQKSFLGGFRFSTMIHFLRKFCQNIVQIPCTVSYGKWSYGKSSHNLNLHQKVRTSNSIKWKNEENLNTDLLENCMKSKIPKALVAKQSFVRERIGKLITLMIENQVFATISSWLMNISIFELNFRKKNKKICEFCTQISWGW